MDVRSLLNALTVEASPCNMRQVWNTLRWLSKIFGVLNVDEVHRLRQKKQAGREPGGRCGQAAMQSSSDLGTGGRGGCRRTGCRALERAAPRESGMDACILGFVRYQVGWGARFDGLQHARTSTSGKPASER